MAANKIPAGFNVVLTRDQVVHFAVGQATMGMAQLACGLQSTCTVLKMGYYWGNTCTECHSLTVDELVELLHVEGTL